MEAAGYSADALSQEARRALAALLYAQGKLTLGQAAQLADMPLRVFIPFLASLNLSPLNYSADELENDQESIEWQLGKK